jgi:hypothetical protein
MTDALIDQALPSAPAVEQAAPAAPAAPPVDPLDAAFEQTLTEVAERTPARADDGKFASKAPVAAASAVSDQPATDAAEPGKPPAIEPPQSWSAEVKAKWSALPPDLQAYVAQRENEAHGKISEQGNKLKGYEGFDAALTNVRGFLDQNRIPAPEYVRRLAAADHGLRTDPLNALRQIAQMYNIDPAQLLAPQHQQMPGDPRYDALSRELASIKSHVQSQQAADVSARVARAQADIDAFKTDRPHFEAVEPLMTKFIESGVAKSLSDAYDMAIHAHPETRTKITEATAKAAADKALADAKAKADAAKRTAPLARRPGTVAVNALPNGNWEDTMDKTYREMRAS